MSPWAPQSCISAIGIINLIMVVIAFVCWLPSQFAQAGRDFLMPVCIAVGYTVIQKAQCNTELCVSSNRRLPGLSEGICVVNQSNYAEEQPLSTWLDSSWNVQVSVAKELILDFLKLVFRRQGGGRETLISCAPPCHTQHDQSGNLVQGRKPNQPLELH